MESHEPRNQTFWKSATFLAPSCSSAFGNGKMNSNLQVLIVSACFKEKIQDLKNSINSSNIKAVRYKTVVWLSAASGVRMPENQSGFQTRSVATITGIPSPQKPFLFLAHRGTLRKATWRQHSPKMFVVKLAAMKYHKNLSCRIFCRAMQEAIFQFWQRYFLSKKAALHLTFPFFPEVFSSAPINTQKLVKGRKRKKGIKYLFQYVLQKLF